MQSVLWNVDDGFAAGVGEAGGSGMAAWNAGSDEAGGSGMAADPAIKVIGGEGSDDVDRPVLRLAHLYPDLLNLYGDYGNILALKRRARLHGIDLVVENYSIGQSFEPAAIDLFFMGGGQDSEQSALHRDLFEEKRDLLYEAVEAGKVFLCICGGYQLMGQRFVTHEGETIRGLGILDIETRGESGRLIGDTAYYCDLLAEAVTDPGARDSSWVGADPGPGAGTKVGSYAGADPGLGASSGSESGADASESLGSASGAARETWAGATGGSTAGLIDLSGRKWSPDDPGLLFGFENHSGRTYLGEGVRPMARVIKGHGNNGKDHTEGAVYKNVYGTYSHGSFLPRNPAMADHLLSIAFLNRYGRPMEKRSLDEKYERLARQLEIERQKLGSV